MANPMDLERKQEAVLTTANLIAMEGYGVVVPECVQDLYIEALRVGKTTILANMYLEDRPWDAEAIFERWKTSEDHKPFGNRGIAIGAVMAIDSRETLTQFRQPGNTRYRLGFATGMLMIDCETQKCRYFPRPGGERFKPLVAGAVHFATFDPNTGIALYPPPPPNLP